MPRPLRIEYEGAWYHVMNRGLDKQNIFDTKQHYEFFLRLLSETSLNYEIEIHAYCLMTNHYHLLIRTPLANLSKAMQYLGSIYTQEYNKFTSRDGPLFKGRYKAILIEDDAYLLQLLRYIHLNPIEAKISLKPEDYSWSSYQYYVNNSSPSWLHKSLVTLFGTVNAKNRFIEFTTGEQSIKKEILPIEYKNAAQTELRRKIIIPSTNKIFKVVTNHFQIGVEDITKSQRGLRNWSRLVVIYLLKVIGKVKNNQICEAVKFIEPKSVNKIVRKIQKYMDNDEHMKMEMQTLISQLKL